jgi:hypothetical protein
MTYGYDPYQGVDQFYNDTAQKNITAPITRWLRDQTKLDFIDVRLPDGHVVRAITRDCYLKAYSEGTVLKDA